MTTPPSTISPGRSRSSNDSDSQKSYTAATPPTTKVRSSEDQPAEDESKPASAVDESKPQSAADYLAELLARDIHFGSLPNAALKKGLKKMGAAKLKEFRERWNDLEFAEWNIKYKRQRLIANQTKQLLKSVSG